jgi:hypothetical protein
MSFVEKSFSPTLHDEQHPEATSSADQLRHRNKRFIQTFCEATSLISTSLIAIGRPHLFRHLRGGGSRQVCGKRAAAALNDCV